MDTTTAESEKKLLADAVRERLIGNKNFVSYGELIDKKLPTFLKNFLQNSVHKYIVTEEPFQFNNSKRFNFEYDKIVELKHQLMKAFEEATIFSQEELGEIINKTISLQYNLLVKPTSSLVNIFFRNKSERLQTEILQILEGLDDQRMIIKKLIEHIKKFDQYHIVEDDFKRILDQTNKEVYHGDFIKAFMGDIRAFVDFLGMIHGIESHRIAKASLRSLFKERKLDKYWAAFEKYPHDTMAIDEIESILRNIISSGKFLDQSGIQTNDDIKGLKTRTFANSAEGDDSSVGIARYVVEIEQSFSSMGASDQNGDQNGVDRKMPKITNCWKDPMDMVIQRSKIESQPTGPLHPLKRMIGEKDRRFLQKRIFDNDIHAYNEFMRQLELIDNWKAAKKLIDSELQNRSIGLYSKEALRLGDLVFNRYFPNSK